MEWQVENKNLRFEQLYNIMNNEEVHNKIVPPYYVWHGWYERGG